MSLVVVRAASWLSRVARRQAARPSPTNASKRQRPLRPTSMSLLPSLLVPSLLERAGSMPVGTTLVDARASKSLSGTGWRVGQRRAVACGGWVLTRGAAPFVGILHVRWRCCPCCHAWTSRFNGLQAPAGFLPGLPTSALCDVFFGLSGSLLYVELLRAAFITAKQERCGAAQKNHAQAGQALRGRRRGTRGECTAGSSRN